MQSGYIEALRIQRIKGAPFENVNKIELEVGVGIIGDCHCGGERQIALLASTVKQWLDFQNMEGLCFHRFKENIITTGIDYSQLKQGDILKTNQVGIEIASYTKRCFNECKRIQSFLPCELKTGIVFAKVIQSGNMLVGDNIWLDVICNNTTNISL